MSEFLLAYLSGLLLNLTPCVYPMISVTLSLFGFRQKEPRFKIFLRALVYVLGMATMYSALGVMAALTGEVLGSTLQSPWVLTGIAILIVALALSLLGVYTFTLPSWLTNALGQKKKVGWFGLFFSGLVVGVFAAPCIGPPILAALAHVATRGDAVYGFLFFFTIAMGLGTPYLVIGTYSNLVSKLPKSGVWLVWVEHLFAVILLGVAAFYFAIAWFPQFLKFLLPISLFIGGIYLGFFDTAGHSMKSFRNFKKTVGIFAIMLSILLMPQQQKPGVIWEPYSSERYALATQSEKPIIIDVYADWCIPCHELDRFTYTDPAVIEELAGYERLKLDVTNPESAESLAATEAFGIQGVPTILFLNSEGHEYENTRVSGFIGPEEMLMILRSSKIKEDSKISDTVE